MTKEKQTLTLTFQDFMKKFRPCPDCNEFRQLQLTYIKTSCHKFDQVCAMTQPSLGSSWALLVANSRPELSKVAFRLGFA